jgi:subtilase family serine protease
MKQAFQWLSGIVRDVAHVRRNLRVQSLSRPGPRASFFRPLRLEMLEDRRVLANLAVTNAFLIDGQSQPITQPVVGEQITVRVNFTTNSLAPGTSYRIAYTVDGVTLSFDEITSGAGLTSGTFHWSRSGWFAESVGSHNVTVTLDADNGIGETNEADNSVQLASAWRAVSRSRVRELC